MIYWWCIRHLSSVISKKFFLFQFALFELALPGKIANWFHGSEIGV